MHVIHFEYELTYTLPFPKSLENMYVDVDTYFKMFLTTPFNLLTR